MTTRKRIEVKRIEVKCANCGTWTAIAYLARRAMHMCPTCGCNVIADTRADTSNVRPMGATPPLPTEDI